MIHSPFATSLFIWIGIAFCIIQSAIFSGLNLAIFCVSKLRRPVRAIDQRVRTDFVVDVGDVDVRRRPPLQGLGYIARPDAPCGTVSEFHQMAPIVSFNLHRRSPV